MTKQRNGEAGEFSGALLQAIPNPLFAIDADDKISFANTGAEQFFKTSARMLAQLDLNDILPFASPMAQQLAMVRQTGSTVNEYEVAIGTPKTGGERVVDLQAGPLHEDPGAVVVLLWQRSMAHKIDRQLTHRSAARTVTGLASMLAHEIKNPLSGIRGAAQLLESAVDGDDKVLTTLICSETDRIRDLVDRMEVFSDERPINPQPVNIHVVLEHVKAIALNGFAGGLQINEVYDPSLPPVNGNRDQLVQIFLNLVKNAAEACHHAGTDDITLTTAYRPGVRLRVPGSGEHLNLPLEVRVQNGGEPIAPEILPHLFDPFVTSKADGKGLGLALVAKIVRDHGGIVDCESLQTRTTFRVLLPVNPTQQPGEGD